MQTRHNLRVAQSVVIQEIGKKSKETFLENTTATVSVAL